MGVEISGFDHLSAIIEQTHSCWPKENIFILSIKNQHEMITDKYFVHASLKTSASVGTYSGISTFTPRRKVPFRSMPDGITLHVVGGEVPLPVLLQNGSDVRVGYRAIICAGRVDDARQRRLSRVEH